VVNMALPKTTARPKRHIIGGPSIIDRDDYTTQKYKS